MKIFRYIAVALMLAALTIACQGSRSESRTVTVSPDRPLTVLDSTDITWPATAHLMDAIEASADGDTLILETGMYYAVPQSFVDSLCGNCGEHQTAVPATVGFVVRDKSLTIIGRGIDSTVLVTGAGYGLYFENAGRCSLRRLAITGGKRDGAEAATDAAVVVRTTRLYMDGCACRDNIDRHDSAVVGIGGVFGREGAEIYLSHSRISNNGWDGVALYRGASAVISDCVISKGRGAGIGVTWDAFCIARRNRISEYWKGIGAFGTSRVLAHNNLVYDNLGWGIVGTGESYLDAANNVVYHNGNCGVAPWSQESNGRIINNIIVENGWREQWVCPCVGVWNYGDLSKWTFQNNLVWNNKDGNYRDMPDVTGHDGNISADPLFVGDGDFHLRPGSQAIDAGCEAIRDTDGSPSDLGMYGGTAAIR